jgi:hypothetical protein
VPSFHVGGIFIARKLVKETQDSCQKKIAVFPCNPADLESPSYRYRYQGRPKLSSFIVSGMISKGVFVQYRALPGTLQAAPTRGILTGMPLILSSLAIAIPGAGLS